MEWYAEEVQTGIEASETNFIEPSPSWRAASYEVVQYTVKLVYKADPHGTENIFHIGQISALYKINNTDSSGRDYRICSHW
jgi:hypothetical protein